jgi:hypothetical protein
MARTWRRPRPVCTGQFVLFITAALLFGTAASAQDALPGPLANASFAAPEGLLAAPNGDDSGSPGSSSSRSSSPSSSGAASGPNSDVTWKTLPVNILRDQKYVWLFPVDVAQRASSSANHRYCRRHHGVYRHRCE